jgi:hypothetical protein
VVVGRLLQPVLAAVADAQVVEHPGLTVAVPDLLEGGERPLPERDGLLELPLFSVDDSEFTEDLQRLLEVGDGLLETPLLPIGDAEVAQDAAGPVTVPDAVRTAVPQVALNRTGRSYRFSFGKVMRSLPWWAPHPS